MEGAELCFCKPGQAYIAQNIARGAEAKLHQGDFDIRFDQLLATSEIHRCLTVKAAMNHQICQSR